MLHFLCSLPNTLHLNHIIQCLLVRKSWSRTYHLRSKLHQALSIMVQLFFQRSHDLASSSKLQYDSSSHICQVNEVSQAFHSSPKIQIHGSPMTKPVEKLHGAPNVFIRGPIKIPPYTPKIFIKDPTPTPGIPKVSILGHHHQVLFWLLQCNM